MARDLEERGKGGGGGGELMVEEKREAESV